jgi:hypothetical protein
MAILCKLRANFAPVISQWFITPRHERGCQENDELQQQRQMFGAEPVTSQVDL